MEASKEYKLKNSRMGIKIYTDFINKKNENNELYQYECLATVSEYAVYDLMILKRDREDWGSFETTYHEIKMRNETVGVNDFETSVVDAYKINTLQKINYQTNCRCFINVIYPKDRTICQWEISADDNFELQNKDVKWKSQSIKENREVTLNKLLVELPISDARKYHY